ncbi:unnamed protein product [Nezara viridula]|uniref:Transmembrane protein 135 N-terminal domain-containing protein n=1 Tax=Nezara viridula TaxID=85310 RepID=A0A9P0HMJ2_NEZVI|nr:unnamed protein product [Nezara viridula]
MGIFSKSPIQNMESFNCVDLIHPWSKSCIKGNFAMFIDSSKGFFFFFIIMHGVQYLFRLRNKKKIYIRQVLFNFMRSMSFGVSYATLFVTMNCVFLKMMGKFNNTLFVYGSPIICGLPIFFEAPERRKITSTTFMSMFLESFYKILVNRKIIVKSKKFETLLFMLVNAFLMYSLRIRQEFTDKKDTLWIFTPASPRNEDHSGNISHNNEKKCPHEYSCKENIIRKTLKYSVLGLAMALVRFTVYKVMSPLKTQESFFQWRSLQLSYFISAYVFIFETVNCYLCKLDGKHHSIHTFWSGLLSGISYWLSPNLQIMSTAATILLKIQGEELKKKFKLPDLPYGELSFVYSNMFILQRLIFDNQTVPKFFLNLLQFATSKRANITLEAIKRLYII